MSFSFLFLLALVYLGATVEVEQVWEWPSGSAIKKKPHTKLQQASIGDLGRVRLERKKPALDGSTKTEATPDEESKIPGRRHAESTVHSTPKMMRRHVSDEGNVSVFQFGNGLEFHGRKLSDKYLRYSSGSKEWTKEQRHLWADTWWWGQLRINAQNKCLVNNYRYDVKMWTCGTVNNWWYSGLWLYQYWYYYAPWKRIHRWAGHCLRMTGSGSIDVHGCNHHAREQQWTPDMEKYWMYNPHRNKCLRASGYSNGASTTGEKCQDADRQEMFDWKRGFIHSESEQSSLLNNSNSAGAARDFPKATGTSAEITPEEYAESRAYVERRGYLEALGLPDHEVDRQAMIEFPLPHAPEIMEDSRTFTSKDADKQAHMEKNTTTLYHPED